MSTNAFRVLHTADWHLGKLLHEQNRDEEHKQFLAFLLETIKKRKIDTLIIAGDVFDSPNPPPTAQKLYYEFLAELHRTTQCSAVVTSGNHDSAAHLEAPKDVLRAVKTHVVGNIPENLEEAIILLPSPESPKLAIAALPFLRDKDIRKGVSGQTQEDTRKSIHEGIRKKYSDISDLAKTYQTQGIPLLATGHLTVFGATPSDSEREIHVGGLGAVTSDIFSDNFSYVALGHLHRPQKIGAHEHHRYSGSPIPLSFSEAKDKKEVRVLEFIGEKLVQNFSIEIPLPRQLFQLKTTEADLETSLQEFQPEPSSLPHWVELIIQTDCQTDTLRETIERITANKPYKIIKMITESSSELDGLRASDSFNEHTLGELLGNPHDVFIQRLDQTADLDEEERQNLITAFDELYELLLESKRPHFSEALKR